MKIAELAPMVLRRRGNMGVRAAAAEIGISPTTLTRIEKGHVPDVATLDKLSAWLGEESSKFTGVGDLQIAFKNKKSVPQATAQREDCIHDALPRRTRHPIEHPRFLRRRRSVRGEIW